MQQAFLFSARGYAGTIIDAIEKQGPYEIAFLVDGHLQLRSATIRPSTAVLEFALAALSAET